MIRAIVFDCFGVFYADPVFAYMHDPSTPLDKAGALHQLDIQAAHGNISKSAFVKQASVLLGLPTKEIQQRFFEGTARNQQLINFAQELRSKYKIALLSNIGGDMMGGFFDLSEQEKLFDTVVLSGNVGIAKPDPKIFELVCRRLGVSLEEAVMVDDVLDYIAAARKLGMQGICYEEFDQFKAELVAIIECSERST
ncbi:MAG TPA: HAD-IA family hydrolase [Candidatus Saccharimonadales bacterium]